MKILLLISILLLSTLPLAAQQGIKGKVVWVSGNQMPGPGAERADHKGIKREIYIYTLTTVAQTTQTDGVFFTDITSKLVKKISSKKNGKFCVKLPPGEYSIFIKEDKGLFANLFDGENHIHPVTVKAGEYENLTIQVNYAASF
jgi:hypothetical protein